MDLYEGDLKELRGEEGACVASYKHKDYSSCCWIC